MVGVPATKPDELSEIPQDPHMEEPYFHRLSSEDPHMLSYDCMCINTLVRYIEGWMDG